MNAWRSRSAKKIRQVQYIFSIYRPIVDYIWTCPELERVEVLTMSVICNLERGTRNLLIESWKLATNFMLNNYTKLREAPRLLGNKKYGRGERRREYN